MELYDARTLPLSSNEELKKVQEKILNNEPLTIKDKFLMGRDKTIKEVYGYSLKSNCAYRVVSYELFNEYIKSGMIMGNGEDDEYQEYEENGKVYNNNKGVDWYLGGACLRYGDVLLECPADKEYFTLAYDNGAGMSIDPSVRFIKSSGTKNPIPFSMITKVVDLKTLKDIKSYSKNELIKLKEELLINSEDEYKNNKSK